MAGKKIWVVYENGGLLTEVEASSERSALDTASAYYGVSRKRLYAVPKSGATGRRSHSTRSANKAKRSHATKKTSDKINIDQLAKMLGLPDWEDVDERNQDYYHEMARGAEDEEAEMKAQEEAQSELYGQWYDAVERVGENLFGEHGLELSQTGKQGTPSRRYEFKVVPTNSWNDAANKIRETINGVGDFHFDDLAEFLRVNSSTARQAVLSHLGYIRDYPAVYGGSGPRQMYDAAIR